MLFHLHYYNQMLQDIHYAQEWQLMMKESDTNPVILFCTASWCVSCNRCKPEMVDLTKKYYQSLRYSPSIASQVVLLLDTYKAEQQDRIVAKAKKMSENGEDDINELIKID